MYLETFLISLAAILLEVSYTRVFSFKLVYYFSYVIIGVAMLGLGSGGVLVATSRGLRRAGPARVVPLCCLAGGVSVLLGYVVVALLPLNLFQLLNAWSSSDAEVIAREGWRLALVVLLVLMPFLAAGLALSVIFSTHADRIGKLYAADLVGAGLGCAISVPLLATITPPGCVMLVGFLLAASGLRLAARWSWRVAAPLLVVLLAGVFGVAFPQRIPEVWPDNIKMRPSEFFHRWSPVFRVDLVPVGDSGLFLAHDGTPSASIRRWDGRLESLAALGFDESDRLFPFRLIGPSPKVAIIGSAGGHEIIASLHYGAGHVTGIELNPVTVDLLRGEFAEFSGRLGENPRVSLVNAEGRSFLGASDETYDLIWLVAPDTYAAMNAATAGAFVLSESYLYTREMILEALGHLGENGILCAQFGEISFDQKPNRTLRYVATVREALESMGIADPSRHILVATAPAYQRMQSTTVLLRRAPFTEADVARLNAAVTEVPGSQLRFAAAEPGLVGPIRDVLTLEGAPLEAWYRANLFDVRPITDDSPFFWHFVRFGDVLGGTSLPSRNTEEGVGERLLILLLVVVALFAAVMPLVPVIAIRSVWRQIPYKGRAGLYFAALGIGFMFVEISLIQRLTLFLGYPTYSLTVTLFSLLTATGIGSLLSERWVDRRDRALRHLTIALIVLVSIATFGLAPLIDLAVGWPLPARIVLAVALLAPLGVCLGAFMPLGLRTVAAATSHGEEFVAWSWAVNGYFSVVSSVLATLLSMTLGLRMLMLVGLLAYLVGIAALRSIPAPGTRTV